MTVPSVETVRGVTFAIGEKAQTICETFHVYPVEFVYAGRRTTFVMDAAVAEIESARIFQLGRLVELMEQAKEQSA